MSDQNENTVEQQRREVLDNGGLWYVIDGGNLFEGSVDHFRDCFFDNANEELIADWCRDEGVTLQVIRPEGI